METLVRRLRARCRRCRTTRPSSSSTCAMTCVFHDGSKFTAEDVKYSYEYMLDPKNKSARRSLFSPIQEIVIESPTRIVFKMKSPYRPWFQYMTKFMGIFPKGSREKIGDEGFKNAPVGVGTGPGAFVEWKQNDYLELKKHANYWRKGVPAWDRMVAKVVTEDAARVAYLMTNQAQIISSPPPREFERLKTRARHSDRQQGRHRRHVVHPDQHEARAVRRYQFPQGGVVRDRPREDRQGRVLRPAGPDRGAGADRRVVSQRRCRRRR